MRSVVGAGTRVVAGSGVSISSGVLGLAGVADGAPVASCVGLFVRTMVGACLWIGFVPSPLPGPVWLRSRLSGLPR